jgi:anti-sigma regulatory factor (Ser/Thr protein kinase)
MVQGQREYDGDLRQLAPMRAFLREVCRESRQGEPADLDLILRLELALTEAASNVILHSCQDQQHKSITLTVEVDDDQVSMTLRHTGKPFDPQTAAAPVFDGSQESGFGLYLIRKCVDEVRYGQDDEGRCVMRLVLKRKQRHRGEDHGARG